MLKRDITYEDFNGNMVTETFYFNISKPEIIEMEGEYEGGMSGLFRRIIEEKNTSELIKYFKRIVLLAYGEKSDDGKHFIKSDKMREQFSYTAAYISLFTELATNEDALVTFIKGVFPKDISGEFDKALAEQTVNAPILNA